MTCAWCPDFVQPTRPGVSHGICPTCAVQLLDEERLADQDDRDARDQAIFEATKRAQFHAFVIDQRTGPRLDAMLADNAATDAAILAEREEQHDDELAGSACGLACGGCGRCS